MLPGCGPFSSYGGLVTSRGPLSLAALASAAVPGLDPSSVEGVVGTETFMYLRLRKQTYSWGVR